RIRFDLADPNAGEGGSAEAVVDPRLVEALNSHGQGHDKGRAFLIWIDTRSNEVRWQLRKIDGLKFPPGVSYISLCIRPTEGGSGSSSTVHDAEARSLILPNENGHSKTIAFHGSDVTTATNSTSTKEPAKRSRYPGCPWFEAYVPGARLRTRTTQSIARTAERGSRLLFPYRRISGRTINRRSLPPTGQCRAISLPKPQEY